MLRDGSLFLFDLTGLQSFEVLPYFIRESVLCHIHADTNRISETNIIGAAMALYHNSVKSEKHRAVITSRIGPLMQIIQRTPDKQIAKLSSNTALKASRRKLV